MNRTTNCIHNPASEQSSLPDLLAQPLETVLADISTLIRNGQSVALIGDGVAYSALLARLCASAWVAEGPYLLLIVDCSQLAALAPSAVLALLGQKLAPLVDPDHRAMVAACERLQSEPSYLHFDALVRQFDRKGQTIVLLLDDFSHLSRNPQLDLTFFNALRATANRYRLVFVTSSEQPLIDLTYLGRAEEIVTSPFFNIFATVSLCAMNKK